MYGTGKERLKSLKRHSEAVRRSSAWVEIPAGAPLLGLHSVDEPLVHETFKTASRETIEA